MKRRNGKLILACVLLLLCAVFFVFRGMVRTEQDPTPAQKNSAPAKKTRSGDDDVDLSFLKEFLGDAGGKAGAPVSQAPVPVPQEEEKSYAPGWEGAEARLKRAGIMSVGEGEWEALVNGKVVSKGKIVKIEHEGQTYRFRAKNITRDEVQWERMDVE